MKQTYQNTNFTAETRKLIATLDDIVVDYMGQGYVLTVRQLYYQMVARGYIENTERSYKRITSIVNDARLAGLIDWDGIEDRTREFVQRQRWESPRQVLEQVAKQYHQDLWLNQDLRCFVIVEKEALAGVLEGICHEMDVPMLAARGYPSGTVLREFAQNDLLPCYRAKQGAIILHLGDHDPSGIDMTRDLTERLDLFIGGPRKGSRLVRIALNMDQIEEEKPPENPAKTTDSRFTGYESQYGDKSWELDALTPNYLVSLVEENIRAVITHPDLWDKRHAVIKAERAKLEKVAKSWK